MSDALSFALKAFLKYGIWIIGLSYLIAVIGWTVFVRQDGGVKSEEDASDLLKRRAILGAGILAIGILLSF